MPVCSLASLPSSRGWSSVYILIPFSCGGPDRTMNEGLDRVVLIFLFPVFSELRIGYYLSSMLCHLRQFCSWFSVEATSVFATVMCEVLLLVESKLVLSWSISYIVVFLEQVFFPFYCFSAMLSRARSILKGLLSFKAMAASCFILLGSLVLLLDMLTVLNCSLFTNNTCT